MSKQRDVTEMTMADSKTGLRRLSDLERQVMEIIWKRGPSTADAVRQGLEPQRSLKDSTVRTILRRLEGKAFLTHEVDRRTYIYSALAKPSSAAAQAVRQVIDRFCGGSVEELLLGLVDNQMVERQQLERLTELIDASERQAKEGATAADTTTQGDDKKDMDP